MSAYRLPTATPSMRVCRSFVNGTASVRGSDRGHEHRVAGLHLDDDGGLLRVALGVDGDAAGDAREVLRLRDGGGEVLARERRRALHRVGEDAGRVVAEGREPVGIGAVLLAVLAHERLDLRAGLLLRVVVRVVAALDRGTADL